MKRSGIVAVTSLGVCALAVGCGSSGVSTAPAQTPTTQPAPTGQKASTGDTINLSDSASGNKIAVTVVKVVDPDSSTNQFETPPAGDRFESVQFRIVNTGSGTYQDDPLADITAKDASGQTMQQEPVTSTSAGPQMPSSENLAPGDTALGFATFGVPTGDKITQVQYSMNLGLSGTTGEWQITPAASTTAPSPPATANSSAQAVVEQYLAAINAGNYALAWSLGGKNIEKGSYGSFVRGFAGTRSDSVTIVSTSGDTVTVKLDTTQTDGTHKSYAGTYTVENGEITASDIH